MWPAGRVFETPVLDSVKGKGKTIAGVPSQFYHHSFTIANLSSQFYHRSSRFA